MAALVTDRFRIFNATTFKNTIDETGGKLFLFIGRPYPWDGTEKEPDADDNYPPIPLDNVNQTGYDHWEAMMAAKKISSGDVAYVIPRKDYTIGEAYRPYNANDNLLHGLVPNMFVLKEGSDEQYRIYKCVEAPLDGDGNPTPTTADITDNWEGQEPTTAAGGYRWKFMYKLTAGEAKRFLTPEHMPIGGPAGTSGSPAEYNHIVDSDTTNPVDPDANIGHANDLLREAGAYYIAINTKLTYDESGTFTTQNDFRQIGLVVNPKQTDNTTANDDLYRQTTKLVLAAANHDFKIDQIITEDENSATPATKARVIDVTSENDKNVLYIQYYPGTTDFVNGNTITNKNANFNEGDYVGTTSTTIETIDERGLKRYTGDVIYIENRKPIPRAPDQTESLTIILEF